MSSLLLPALSSTLGIILDATIILFYFILNSFYPYNGNYFGASVGTIKTKANVCCVQFPPDSGRYLAFGSADHRIYYYDLRNSRIPLCAVNGHSKTEFELVQMPSFTTTAIN